MKLIPLTKGYEAIVDDEDFEELSRHKWHAKVHGRPGAVYAARYFHRNGKGITERMHRRIMQPARGLDVDHVNGNGLDNRRSNLRVCTRSENCANSNGHSDRASRFKGVVAVHGGVWRAKIEVNYRNIHLGRFATEEEAALAYNAAAVEHFGEFARLNEVTEEPISGEA